MSSGATHLLLMLMSKNDNVATKIFDIGSEKEIRLGRNVQDIPVMLECHKRD
jgi:hypothetical protein